MSLVLPGDTVAGRAAAVPINTIDKSRLLARLGAPQFSHVCRGAL